VGVGVGVGGIVHVVVSHGWMIMAAGSVSLQPVVELVTLTLIGVAMLTCPCCEPTIHGVVLIPIDVRSGS
jgi:hypothetical protein